jgi:UDP:flavonoid glycosyltransferase YjiC (YdhE family)
MGTIDWRTSRLRIDGNTAEPCGQRFSHNCATSTLKNVQIVLSLGEHVDPKEIGPLPTTAITVKWAPQLELLKRASVCITHAGLNTVLEALAQGVPQVAIPVHQ